MEFDHTTLENSRTMFENLLGWNSSYDDTMTMIKVSLEWLKAVEFICIEFWPKKVSLLGQI